MDVTLRPARPDEYDAVGELILGTYQALPGSATTPEYAAILRDTAARADASEVVVAVDGDGALLGSVTFALAPSPWAPSARDGEAEFRMLVTDPTAQRQGIGESLVNWTVGRARELGAPRLVLATMPWMTRAHALYDRLGFQRTPQRDWSPRPGVDCLTYALEL